MRVRLDKADAEDEHRERSQRLDRRFELGEAVLLSIAALLAAWAGFQSSNWSGVQDDLYNQASASRAEASQASGLANQETTIDVVTFTQWLQAGQQEGSLDGSVAAGEGYVPDRAALSGFLYERFRPEFKVAVDAWIAAQADGDPPPTPFAMAEYHLEANDDAARLEADAERDAAAARQANGHSDKYVLMTIMFATVLFFAGISSKMDTAKARVFLIGMGVTVLVVATAIVLSFPKEL